MPVHALVLGPLIAILVTLSKHSSITIDPLAKYVSVILRVPAACVIVKERYPSLSVDDCVVTLTQSRETDKAGRLQQRQRNSTKDNDIFVFVAWNMCSAQRRQTHKTKDSDTESSKSPILMSP